MITHIVAHDLKNAIGGDNQLLWHLPEDLKRFKELTTGKTVIMGRKTHESIGCMLPNRQNLIVSRSGLSIDDAIQCAEHEIYIIGGAEIYSQTMHLADKIELTLVKRYAKNADAFYPKIDLNEFEISERYIHDEYDFITYLRKPL